MFSPWLEETFTKVSSKVENLLVHLFSFLPRFLLSIFSFSPFVSFLSFPHFLFLGEGTIVYKDAYGCDYTGDWSYFLSFLPFSLSLFLSFSFFSLFSTYRRDNKPHGYGVFKGEGVVYDGEWRGGKREGKGKMVFVEGEGENEKYEGEWKNDLIDGKFVFLFLCFLFFLFLLTFLFFF